MKIEMQLGTFIATVAITYAIGQCVGCIKTAALNIIYDDVHKS